LNCIAIMAKELSREEQLAAEHEKKPGFFKRLFTQEPAEKGKYETVEKERGPPMVPEGTKMREGAVVEDERMSPETLRQRELQHRPAATATSATPGVEHESKEKKPGFFERLFGTEEEHKAYESETGAWQAKHKIAREGVPLTEEVQLEQARLLEKERVVIASEERRVTGEATRQIEEKATRKVIEERVPQEHVRYIEEVQRLGYPKLKESSGIQIIDTKETKLPLERRHLGTQQVRLPVEHVKVFEEVVPLETIHVFEEQEKQQLGQPVQGPVVKEGGVEQVRRAAASRRIVQEGDITGIVQEIRRFEEIERWEKRRIVEERVALDQPLALRDFERTYKAKIISGSSGSSSTTAAKK
jgi:hypothetical protein